MHWNSFAKTLQAERTFPGSLACFWLLNMWSLFQTACSIVSEAERNRCSILDPPQSRGGRDGWTALGRQDAISQDFGSGARHARPWRTASTSCHRAPCCSPSLLPVWRSVVAARFQTDSTHTPTDPSHAAGLVMAQQDSSVNLFKEWIGMIYKKCVKDL